MHTSQKTGENTKFICSFCSKPFSGIRVGFDDETVFINPDDIQGYSCKNCQVIYCGPCAQSQVFRHLLSSPCPHCQSPFLEADIIHEEQTSLFRAQGFQKRVDANDGGGAISYDKAIVTLFSDHLCITARKRNYVVGTTEAVFLDKIADIQVTPSISDDSFGTLKLISPAKSFLGRYFAMLPKVYFNQEQEPRMRELADNITRALKFLETRSRSARTSQMADPFQPSSNHDISPAPSRKALPSLEDIAVLEKLAALHEKGILTDEEFAVKKARILNLL